jgi:hypothetical protein
MMYINTPLSSCSERARELQKIPPPKCFCGLPSRLNRVKRSKEGGDSSRAIGKYFFFCSKKRDDETQCRFARPVEMEINKQKARAGNAKAVAKNKLKEMKEEKKAAEPEKNKQICKFFAKTGSCKKGKKCEFSHDVGVAKKPAVEDKSKKDHKPKVEEMDASDDIEKSSTSSSEEQKPNNDDGGSSSSSDSE